MTNVKRFLLLFVICSLLCPFIASAQRGWRGGRGGWGGEVGAPPKFPTVADVDGSWHFCRLMYRSVRSQQRGLGWGTDYPYADINFSIRLSELTKTQVGMLEGEPNHLVVRPTDPELFQCPFVMASDPGSAGFSPEDAAGLRDYLLKGGFLWVDDFWGPWAWEAFTDEIAKALPRGRYPITEIGPDHPIYRTLFPVSEIPQVPSMQFWRMSGGSTSEMDEYIAKAHMAAILDQQGRIMVLMTHNTDIADSWEREADDPQFFFHFSPNGYAVGLNAVLYAMTH
jgi:hypothetical protein